VEIVGYRVDEGRTIVGYREESPARGAMTAQVITSPYEIVTIPMQSGEVRLERLGNGA
jgi:hypothetical protein